jgi:hypothetical protein
MINVPPESFEEFGGVDFLYVLLIPLANFAGTVYEVDHAGIIIARIIFQATRSCTARNHCSFGAVKRY